MKKFFNEYGGIAVIVFVIAILLVLVGSIKGLDTSNNKIKGTGISSVVGNNYTAVINKFNNRLNYFNGECGPNGESLVSKNELQVGKYADIVGDGTVDGIIFADLMVGGSGQWNTEKYGIQNSFGDRKDIWDKFKKKNIISGLCHQKTNGTRSFSI